MRGEQRGEATAELEQAAVRLEQHLAVVGQQHSTVDVVPIDNSDDDEGGMKGRNRSP